MQLSIIILNYNVRHFLELCLISVEKAIKNIDAEIIVVDNNSSDESCQMIRDYFPNIILIENKENVGFSRGNNIGVSKAKGYYLCILNPDTVVAEDTFENILSNIKTQSNLGVLGCQMIDGSGEFLPESKRNIPTPLVSLKKIMGFTESYYASHLKPNHTGQVEVLAGAFMFLKKEVYIEVNGFDEDYFMYGEDIDLSFKIKQKGYQNYYLGTEKIIHFKGESTMKDKTYRKRFYKAMRLFYAKHFKSNILFDSLIYLGIHLAKYLPEKRSEPKIKTQNFVLMSIKIYPKFSNFYKDKLILKNTFDSGIKNSKLFFDIDFCDFKSIIDILSKSTEAHQNSYRFLVKKTDYFVGSDSSKSRGEIIQF